MSKNLGDPRPSKLPKTSSTIKMPKTTKVTPPKGRTLREGQEPERPVTINVNVSQKEYDLIVKGSEGPTSVGFDPVVEDIAYKNILKIAKLGSENPNRGVLHGLEDMNKILDKVEQENKKSNPRQYSLVKLSVPKDIIEYYANFVNKTFCYLGEIPNMQGQAILIDIHSQEIHIGMHIENFKELSEDEV